MITYRNIIIGLGTAMTTGFIAWTMILPTSTTQPTMLPHKDLPDAFMEDVVAVILDKQGKPKMKIASPYMVHYPQNDMTELETPKITLYRQSATPWFITSKYGKALQGIKQVDFWNNVNIHHAADEKAPATLIKTDTLTIYPQAKLADTQSKITLEQPGLVVKAVGMHVDMNAGDIKLLSQARGEYVPNS